MRTIITIILFTLSFNIYGQETEIVIKDGVGFKEQYSVLKQTNKIRHGTYIKYTPLIGERVLVFELGNYLHDKKHGQWEKFYELFPHETWNTTKEIGSYFEGKKHGLWSSYYIDSASSIINAKNLSSLFQTKTVINDTQSKNTKLKQAGMFLNDKRVGEWVTFDNKGSLIQKYNFSKAKLLFDKSIPDSSKYNINRKSLFIGGQLLLSELLMSNVDWKTVFSIVKKDSTNAIITFNINENGTINNVSIETNLNNKIFKEELTRLIMLTDTNWLPSIENDVVVTSTYRIRCDVIQTEKHSNSKRWIYRFKTIE